jgi:hypothetical protein
MARNLTEFVNGIRSMLLRCLCSEILNFLNVLWQDKQLIVLVGDERLFFGLNK